jgi:hypothetical protein
MSKRRMPRNNPRRRLKTSKPLLMATDIDVNLIDLVESGLIKFEMKPNGEVRLLTPLAPAPACNGSLVWEG